MKIQQGYRRWVDNTNQRWTDRADLGGKVRTIFGGIGETSTLDKRS
jgi:hypothetical protein